MKTILFNLLGYIFFFNNLCTASQTPFQQEQFYSQASQDRFVYTLLYQALNKQNEGYYLEIGSAHPNSGNNTYFLEKHFGWKGVSIDISSEFLNSWYSSRQNLLLIEDATKSDYQSILALFPKYIDYLSLDIDSSYDTVLRNLLLSNHIFKIITIEHDFYRYGDTYRKGEREILESAGYYLLCPDVSVFFDGRDVIFEDWWIHPSAFPADLLSKLTAKDLKTKKHDHIISIIQNLKF